MLRTPCLTRRGLSASTAPTGLLHARNREGGVRLFDRTNPGVGKTVAVVVAYDNPQAEIDLLIFSLVYGLPLCTTSMAASAR